MGDGEASPPSPARVKPWRALDFMLASESALANPYVRAFVDEKPLLERFLHDPAMAHWSKKKNLRKEVTEAMGALIQIRRCVDAKERDGYGPPRDARGEPQRTDSGSGLVFVDLCAGRGMLSIVLAHFFPQARVLMVDSDPKIKLPHLACLPTVEHHLLNIQSAEALDLVRGVARDATRACIVVGVHLCGDLSRRAAAGNTGTAPGPCGTTLAVTSSASTWPWSDSCSLDASERASRADNKLRSMNSEVKLNQITCNNEISSLCGYEVCCICCLLQD